MQAVMAEGTVRRSWFGALMLGSGSSSSVPGLYPHFCTGASSALAELDI